MKKAVGITAIASGVLALACLVLSVIAASFNFDAISNPVLMLSMPGASVGLLRWSMIADLFGYYLLLLPAIFYLHDWMKSRTPWCSFLTFCGTSYVLVGAIGASVLAVAGSSLVSTFQNATTGNQEQLKQSFQVLIDMVYGGMWNLLEVILGGVWWLGVGIFLRSELKTLGFVTIILGFFTLVDGVGAILEMKILSEAGLNVYLLLAPVWAIWLGAVLTRSSLEA